MRSYKRKSYKLNYKKISEYRWKQNGIVDASYEWYLNQISIQGNACAICRQSFNTVKPCLDHCHKTGKARSVLCVQCNAGIGMFKDNVLILENAIRYLIDNKKDT